MSLFLKNVTLLGGCALASFGLTGCSSTSQAKEEAASKPAAAITTVAVAKATTANLAREIVLTGEFRPYQSVEVHAKVAGYLKKINVDVGDRVKAGQLLATLEIPEADDEMAHAAASTERSHAEVTRAQRELERAESSRQLIDLSYERLAKVNKAEPGLVAQQEIDEALTRKQTAEAQVAAARAALLSSQQSVAVSRATERRSKTMADYSQISAPFSGVVTKRYADTGAMIQAGTASQTQAMPVVRISQIDRLRLVIPVPESAVPQLRNGAGVLVRVRSLNKEFAGSVARLSKDVLTSTRTMEAEIDVSNASGALTPGMYADVVLTLEKRPNAVTVPVQAIVTREGIRTVLVVNADGAIEERTIKVGLETPARVEVLSGLQADELVIIGNRAQLRAGQKVEAKITGVS